jgi:hypothetical protein
MGRFSRLTQPSVRQVRGLCQHGRISKLAFFAKFAPLRDNGFPSAACSAIASHALNNTYLLFIFNYIRHFENLLLDNLMLLLG